eukprot:2387576-Prymnesium_polylepis.1
MAEERARAAEARATAAEEALAARAELGQCVAAERQDFHARRDVQRLMAMLPQSWSDSWAFVLLQLWLSCVLAAIAMVRAQLAPQGDRPVRRLLRLGSHWQRPDVRALSGRLPQLVSGVVSLQFP